MNTREKLIAAAQRIRAGSPIRIDPKRAFSPCAIEDEADLARSTLYGEKYADLLQEFKNEKGQVGHSLVDYQQKYKNEKNKNKGLRKANKMLEEQVESLLQRNAELTQNLISKRYDDFFGQVKSG